MAIIIDGEKCSACGVCVDACPVTALELQDEKLSCNDECIDCGVCADSCPSEALSMP